MSGGRSTVAFKKGMKLANQVGDISCISPVGQKFIDSFAVEAKFYADLDYQGLLTGKGKLLAFWAEINEQAGRYGKLPFLVARQNRMPANVCLDTKGMEALKLDINITTLISIPRDMYIISFEFFIRTCKPFV